MRSIEGLVTVNKGHELFRPTEQLRISPAPKLGGRAGQSLRFLSVSRGEAVLTDVEQGSWVIGRQTRGLPVMHQIWFAENESFSLGYRKVRVGRPSDLLFLSGKGNLESQVSLPDAVSEAAWSSGKWIVACKDGRVYAFLAEGTLLWKYAIPVQLRINLMMGPFADPPRRFIHVGVYGDLIVAAEGSRFTALNAFGRKEWCAHLPPGRHSIQLRSEPAEMPTRAAFLRTLGIREENDHDIRVGYLRLLLGRKVLGDETVKRLEMYDVQDDIEEQDLIDDDGDRYVDSLSRRDEIRCLSVSRDSIAIGTGDGLLHVFDHQGSLTASYAVGDAPATNVLADYQGLKACYVAGLLTQFRAGQITGSVKLPEYTAALTLCGDHILAWRWRSAWLVDRTGRVIWRAETSHPIRGAFGEAGGFCLLAGGLLHCYRRAEVGRSPVEESR